MTDEELEAAGWNRNTLGTQPGMTAGKRVKVLLGDSIMPAKGDWTADKPTRWTLTGSRFDISWWRLT